MDNRIVIDDILVNIIGMTETNGDTHVYFNPPPSIRMVYPAIKYSLNNFHRTFASNGVYHSTPSYEVTLIDEDPDSIYVELILAIQYCRFDRFYISDNLNHWVFTIYNH